ncbi:MAG: 5-formyltetrahydrofolate cyclo-ligase [Candidatus Omnitrophica bacterium]|nr:5-formyltetrahydrofolate cyclo-ligase [Candidatus Omnitrophota bacterium]
MLPLIKLTKRQNRSKIIPKLKTQKERERKLKSRLIREKLFKTLVFRRAKVIMFYIAFNGEVDTKEMIKEAQKLGKIIVVPVCRKDRVIRACFLGDQTKLARGPYGISEPAVKESIDLRYLDLVITPGVAFDKQGNRLGRGKGYYDRFLKKLHRKTTSIGLAFDFQILPSVPTAMHDVAVDRVIFA